MSNDSVRLTPEQIETFSMTEDEKMFFESLLNQAEDVPVFIKKDRDMYSIYGIGDNRVIASIAITKIPRCYAVYKIGAIRATKLYDNKKDAELAILGREDAYEIRTRYISDHTAFHFHGRHNRDYFSIQGPSLGDCLSQIPAIVSAVRSCKLEHDRSTRELKNIALNDYTVIDVETTGLSKRMDEIIEISAVRVRGGKIQDRFTSFVRPTGSISAAASAVNGITDDMVRNAPAPGEVCRQFFDFIGDDVLIGHKVTFDLDFIGTNFRAPDNRYLDTLNLSRQLLHLDHCRLADVAEHYHISPSTYHRSLADCETTYQIYERMKKKLAPQKKSRASISPKPENTSAPYPASPAPSTPVPSPAPSNPVPSSAPSKPVSAPKQMRPIISAPCRSLRSVRLADFAKSVSRYFTIRSVLWIASAALAFLSLAFLASETYAFAAVTLVLLLASIIAAILYTALGKVQVEYNFDDSEQYRYECLIAALESLRQNQSIWQVNAVYQDASGGQTLTKTPIQITPYKPRFLRTNAACYYIKLKAEKLYILPDRMILIGNSGCGAIDLHEIDVSVNTVNYPEIIPARDAQIIQSGPGANGQATYLCQYGDITCRTSSGLNIEVHLSNPQTLQSFCGYFNQIRQ